MAEFQEVIRQRNRMCEIFDCADCPLSYDNNGISDVFCDEFIRDYPAEAEAVIMKWAAKHPEPVYPSWEDAWKQLCPDAYFVNRSDCCSSPCLKHFLPKESILCLSDSFSADSYSCCNCRKQPIPADIAKKLGIEPINQ